MENRWWWLPNRKKSINIFFFFLFLYFFYFILFAIKFIRFLNDDCDKIEIAIRAFDNNCHIFFWDNTNTHTHTYLRIEKKLIAFVIQQSTVTSSGRCFHQMNIFHLCIFHWFYITNIMH